MNRGNRVIWWTYAI